MPPRYAYWTILAGGLPTSFRAAEAEDLLPTLRRLQERHPDAEMKWFARGKLWASPEAARTEPPPVSVPRGREWRPGGEHRDPREKYKTAKREHNLARREQRFKRKHGAPTAAPAPRVPRFETRPPSTPKTDAGRSAAGPRPWGTRPASAPARKERRNTSTTSVKARGGPERTTGRSGERRPFSARPHNPKRPGDTKRPPKGGRNR